MSPSVFRSTSFAGITIRRGYSRECNVFINSMLLGASIGGPLIVKQMEEHIVFQRANSPDDQFHDS